MSQKLLDDLLEVVKTHPNVFNNIDRKAMIQHALDNREVITTKTNALVTWTRPESSGRSPKDTVVVRRPESEATIDWDSPNMIAISEETFDIAWAEALEILKEKGKIYVTDRVIGADSSYVLPTKTITSKALLGLFSDNMFRPVPEDVDKSIFAERGYTVLALPLDKLGSEKYEGRLRKLPNGQTSNMIVAMDFDRRLGLIVGSDYCGSLKKLMFTVMNYYLPAEGILPIHASANEGKKGDIALLLGLSGTGKTTLSADPRRSLLGDDEHGWNDHGVANFEHGCYAKLIDLSKKNEPEIYKACFEDRPVLENGVILENTMVYPNGEFDLFDDRFTPNSRGSYPLTFLSNIKPESTGGHPKTILFLTADANGVLPPISKLTADQAMLWFLMGFTSKLAGTETGVVEPLPTFSRFFGEPFMPRNPDDYTNLLGKKMEEHKTNVFLVNTGWSGGPHGVGARMSLPITRALVEAALEGKLDDVEYEEDPLFHVNIPKTCPGVDSNILFPKNTWEDKQAFEERAKKLAKSFANHFDKAFAGKVPDSVEKACPGK